MRQLTAPALLLPVLLSACSAAAGVGDAGGGDATSAGDDLGVRFLADLGARARAAEAAGLTVVDGRDGFLFFVPELRSLGAGRFWGEAAARVGRAAAVEARDPLPAILDFRDQLERAGIDLLLVPVPAKAVIYPETISDLVTVAPGGSPPRLDPIHREFLDVLAAGKVKTLDLVPAFLAHRFDPPGPLYCRQDTHWSSPGAALAAREIAATVRGRPWLAAVPRKSYGTVRTTIEITGDLWSQHLEPRPPRERLAVVGVGEKTDAGLDPVAPWRESPVLLLADSHGLVFHGGADMHAERAGLADHLGRELGFPVDLVAVRGLGATPARVNLLRRGDGLAGKKLVIWCLSVREFTEGQGWKKVPILRPEK